MTSDSSHIRLDRLQKIALARVMSDLIESDFIVDEGEMLYYEQAISKAGFGITPTMLIEGKKLDLAKAIERLKHLPTLSQATILHTLHRLALSDGSCEPPEALLIMALEQVLTHGASIYSQPADLTRLCSQHVIYVESEENSSVAHAIEQQFETISNTLVSAGFDFVYIPHIARDFDQLSPDYLTKVVRYMIPSISAISVQSICQDLRHMTTARFCSELLEQKLGLPLLNTLPSLLLQINESALVSPFSPDQAERTQYANYLLLPLTSANPLSQIRSFVERYQSLLSSAITPKPLPSNKQFLYYGFHRSLFNLIAFGHKHKDYRLVFNLAVHRPSVYFEPIDHIGESIPLQLNPQETALYYMIAQKSVNGIGLDWRDLSHIPHEQRSCLLAEYNAVYSRFGKGNTTSSYKDRTRTNHIRNRINALHDIANRHLFLPENIKDSTRSYYRIRANQQQVTFIKPTTQSSQTALSIPLP